MSSGRDVPSLPDTSGIADPHTKRVVDAVVNMLQVRNGDKGNGDAAFLTKASLENLLGDNYPLLAMGDAAASRNISTQKGSVGQAIRDLKGKIGGSPLSIYLAQKIDMIDRPTTGLTARVERVEVQAAATADSFAAVQTKVSTLTDGFSAQAMLTNTIQARLDNVDGSNATIEQKFQTLVSADDKLKAQYTIKVQLGKYVAGFGLLAQDNGDGPESLFLVRADQFAIGQPGLNDFLPFIVIPGPHKDSQGGDHPNGAVYIDDGMLTNFQADTGNIKRAAVGTLQIAGYSITVPMIDGGFGGISIDSTVKTVASLTIDWGTDPDLVPEMVLVCAMVQCDYASGSSPGGTGIQLRLWDGAGRGLDNPFAAINQSFPDGFSGSGTLVHGVAGQLGERTYTLTAQRISGSGNYTGGTYSIAIQGAKR